MNIFTRLLFELQEMSLLAARAARGIFKKPHYIPETIAQMDDVGGITKGINQNRSHALSFANQSRLSGGLSARSGRTYDITAKWQLRRWKLLCQGLA